MLRSTSNRMGSPRPRLPLGALINRSGNEPTYHPVVSWDALDEAGAIALAREFADWLHAQNTAAEEACQTVLVYHYYLRYESSDLPRVRGSREISAFAWG